MSLGVEDIAGVLSAQEARWAARQLAKLQSSPWIDSDGYAASAFTEVLVKEDREGGFDQLTGLQKGAGKEHALAYLLAYRMRSDQEASWSKTDMLNYINELMKHIGGQPVSQYMLGKWIKTHFDPPWPRHSKKGAPQLIGGREEIRRISNENKERLDAARESVFADQQESKQLSAMIIGGAHTDQDTGRAQQIKEQLALQQIDTEEVKQGRRVLRQTRQQIIEQGSMVREGILPEGYDLPEATQLLFALTGRSEFSQALLKEGSFLLAQGNSISAKDTENWWRASFELSLGMKLNETSCDLADGSKLRIISESSSTDVYDLVIEHSAPGRKPMYLTLQFKSYVDTSPTNHSFNLCKLGGTQDKNGNSVPRSGRQMAQEIAARVKTTGAFANVSVRPIRDNVTCPVREAETLYYSAECLHPAVQAAITEGKLVRAFKAPDENGVRTARIRGQAGPGNKFDFTISVAKSGAVTFSGLNEHCWMEINKAEMMTSLMADHHQAMRKHTD